MLCIHSIEKENLKSSGLVVPSISDRTAQPAALHDPNTLQHCLLARAWSSGQLLLNIILCFTISTCRGTILLFSKKKKKINCPQQSTYTVLGKYGLNTLLQSKQGTRRVRGIHHCACAFYYSHQVFLESLSSNDPVPWGRRTIFTNTCQ